MNELLAAYVVAFLLSFYVVIKSADYAIEYAARLAREFDVSEFVISFFLIGFVSALPEAVIALSAGSQAKPDIAAIALLGSNVVDLTFVFGAVALFAAGLRITAPVIRREAFYLLLLALPFVLGFDGELSRIDGVGLVLAGIVFLATVANEHRIFTRRKHTHDKMQTAKSALLLCASLLVMVVSANFTVSFVSLFAREAGVSPLLIAVFVIGIGTCLPELLFTIRSMQKQKYEMALGNVLGVVIIDATIMLGGVAALTPLPAGATLLRVMGFFNIIGGLALLYFLKFHQKLTRWEAIILLGIYSVFALVQFIMH